MPERRKSTLKVESYEIQRFVRAQCSRRSLQSVDRCVGRVELVQRRKVRAGCVESLPAPANVRYRPPKDVDGSPVAYAAYDCVGVIAGPSVVRSQIGFIEEDDPLPIVGSFE